MMSLKPKILIIISITFYLIIKKENIMKQGTAFWISPSGEVHLVPERHIDFVARNLQLFGLTYEEYKAYFDKFKEPIGLEGKARSELFIDLFEKGWIRIRENSDKGWIIEFWSISELDFRERIMKWSDKEAVTLSKFNSTRAEFHLIGDAVYIRKSNVTSFLAEKAAFDARIRLKLTWDIHYISDERAKEIIEKIKNDTLDAEVMVTTIENISNNYVFDEFLYFG